MRTHNLESWRVRKDTREVRGLVEMRQGTASWDHLVGLGLRVEHSGEVYLTELRRSKADVELRSAAFLTDLEAHGWALIIETTT